nr:EOG090X0ECZ [Triops cancriformis]
MSGKFRGNAGDWTCPDTHCANVNFARRDACNRCGVPRGKKFSVLDPKCSSFECVVEVAPSKAVGIEIGKAAAEKSKGLFSADDWQCSKCGNVNWARRSTCNVCNAPKVSDVEERTGYGGGYNEREGIEYVEREESDSEFDEFGRRKKKYRKSLPEKEKEKPAPPVETKEEDNEDDEEDDDDDDDGGDLSKYDLAGWSDLDDDKAKKDEPESDSKRDRRLRIMNRPFNFCTPIDIRRTLQMKRKA